MLKTISTVQGLKTCISTMQGVKTLTLGQSLKAVNAGTVSSSTSGAAMGAPGVHGVQPAPIKGSSSAWSLLSKRTCTVDHIDTYTSNCRPA